MEKVLSAYETRRKFGKVIRGVTKHRDVILVKQWGKPVAKIVPTDAVIRIQEDRINEIRKKLARFFKDAEDIDSVSAIRAFREEV